ncbi:MAG: hypothetical protein ACI4XL_02870 [Bacillus sp. (in: firmicutes)]
MYKRIIVIVSCALFALLALLAVIITDLYDRDFPQAVGVESRLSLNFSESGLSIDEAFTTLEELDKKWNLGLIKVAPDLADDGDGQVFVALNGGDIPSEFTWFGGDRAGKVVGRERLASSYPDGFYLVTKDNRHLDEFEETLRNEGVKVVRRDASVFSSLGFVVQERGFAAAVLASFALIAALSLFWLSLRARGRALRVLGGCPTIRIQVQDLAGFGGALLASAFIVALVSSVFVGMFYGWIYVGSFLKVLISLQVAVIAVSLLAALIISASAWPSTTLLATRQPAVKSLRTAAIVTQALTFLLVVASIGPAWSSYKNSSVMAAEMAQWKQLADQVAIVFATEVDEMDQMEPQIGQLIKEAESLDTVALSYTYTQEMLMGRDLGGYSAISYVNQRWLDLMAVDATDPAFKRVPYESIPEGVNDLIQEQADILSREGSSEELLGQFKFLRPADGFKLPVAQGGGGERLHFLDDALVVVVPSLFDTYNDSALTSLASTSNVVFTGVTDTQQLLEKQGLDVQALRDRDISGELKVVYIAEEGLLQAQFAAYIVWLLNLALVALVIAFTVAAAISALITALLKAKHDFPLRLAGRSWIWILQGRVIKEILAGVGLVVIVLVLQRPDEMGAVLVGAAFGLLVVPLCHMLASRWCFDGVSRRRI